VDGITREVILIELNLNNMSREEGVLLSAVFYSFKERTTPTCDDTQLTRYTTFQSQRMQAFLALHVLHLAVFLFSFFIWSIFAVLFSGMF
jgi:hypothetical protein